MFRKKKYLLILITLLVTFLSIIIVNAQEVSTEISKTPPVITSLLKITSAPPYYYGDIINAEFLTHISTTDQRNNESRKVIGIDTDVLISNKSEEHEVLKRNFTRYTYKFSGRLTSIMAYVSCLTDAINYFQMIWGYGEDGNEHCLLQYPIGSIVSKPKDKSKDYLILEYDFSKNTNDVFKIRYYACEMLNTDSSVIQYGESLICEEDELCHSRNNRIDDILN